MTHYGTGMARQVRNCRNDISCHSFKNDIKNTVNVRATVTLLSIFKVSYYTKLREPPVFRRPSETIVDVDAARHNAPLESSPMGSR